MRSRSMRELTIGLLFSAIYKDSATQTGGTVAHGLRRGWARQKTHSSDRRCWALSYQILSPTDCC